MYRRLRVGDLIREKKAHSQTGPFGTQLKASEYVEEGFPVINVRNIGMGDVRADNLEYINEEKAFELKSHSLRENDIVFGRKGAVERHSFITKKEEGWIQGSDCIRLRFLNQEFNPKFISYFFRTQTHQQWMINLGSFGATMGSLNQEIISKIEIPDIKRELQDKIASILSAYDDLIENNNLRIKLLEEMAEEIYKEWFVRLRFPDYQNTKFFDLEGKDVEHGTVGALPEGWHEIYFKDFIKLNRGFDLPNEKIVSGEYPVIASTSIKAYHHQFKVSAPCVVTGRSGSLGTVQFVNKKAWPLNTSLYVKDFKGNSPFFVYYFLKKSNLQRFDSGAGVPTLNQNHLKGLRVNLPNVSIQKKFDKIIKPMFDEVETLQQKNQILQETKDLLLPRLISGKLNFEELEMDKVESLLMSEL